MNKKGKIGIMIGAILLILVGVIGITYAFFSTGGSQEQANTFTSGCLNISLTDASAAINLTNSYPIPDVEGLEGTSYDFTITNTCTTSANYSINLESLNQIANSLSADYIKVALSSDTVGNVISTLSDNTSVTPEIDGAYESYNLYTGTLGASETKTYHLKLWLDYDATVEEAANKVYSSKISVVANPETQVVDNLEATFTLSGTNLTATLSSDVTSATYCETTNNKCNPSTVANITSGRYTIEAVGDARNINTSNGTLIARNNSNSMICTKLNNTSKVICSDPVEVQGEYVYDDYGNFRYIGASPNNYVYYNCSDYANPNSNSCELWRIIGVFSEDTHGISNTKLIKLIRNDNIGSYSWDSKPYGVGSSVSSQGSSDWSDARLMMLLNSGYEEITDNNVYAYEGSLYYNAKSGTCYSGSNEATTSCNFTSTGLKNDETRNMIETVTWKLGRNSNAQATVNTFYAAERETDVDSTNATEWNGKIGLMYPSDYGYATGGGETLDRTTCLNTNLSDWGASSNSDCKNNNWLKTGSYQWTLMPSSSSLMPFVFYVFDKGNLTTSSPIVALGVRPSIYLKSSVTISGGTGSISNPYTLLP